MKKLNYLFLALFLCGCSKAIPTENLSEIPKKNSPNLITETEYKYVQKGIFTQNGMTFMMIECRDGIVLRNLTLDSLSVAGMKAANIRQEWIDFYKEMLEENKDAKRNKKQ